MLINRKCEHCNEPSKRVVGFWDGARGKNGSVYDCENGKCGVRQLIKATAVSYTHLTLPTNSRG